MSLLLYEYFVNSSRTMLFFNNKTLSIKIPPALSRNLHRFYALETLS